jgi:hypothetical protein
VLNTNYLYQSDSVLRDRALVGTINNNSGTDDYYFAANFLFTTSAVPEPASWAMMLIGFGGLGAVLRERRLYRKTFA